MTLKDFTPKDYVTVGISILALLVSGTTAFFNFFFKKYQLKVNIDSDYVEQRRQQRLELFLVNSGNRPIAVRRIRLVPYTGAEDASAGTWCESYRGRGADIDATRRPEPFIVKAGEVAFQRLYFDIAPHLQPNAAKTLICVRFGFGAADRWRWAEHPLLQIVPSPGGELRPKELGSKDLKPIDKWFISF